MTVFNPLQTATRREWRQAAGPDPWALFVFAKNEDARREYGRGNFVTRAIFSKISRLPLAASSSTPVYGMCKNG
eukprot:COSAG06_NODE_2988_length_5984_cov_63.200170_2_plen_74_part_00